MTIDEQTLVYSINYDNWEFCSITGRPIWWQRRRLFPVY